MSKATLTEKIKWLGDKVNEAKLTGPELMELMAHLLSAVLYRGIREGNDPVELMGSLMTRATTLLNETLQVTCPDCEAAHLKATPHTGRD